MGFDFNNILSFIHFEIKGNILECASTDGNRMLRSRVDIDNHSNIEMGFNIECYLLEKMVIFKANNIPVMRCIIDKENDSIKFVDLEHHFSQQFAFSTLEYPNYNRILKDNESNENLHSIGLNQKFFKDMSEISVNEYSNIIELILDKEDNSKPIIVKNKSDNIKQVALLMPVMIRG